MRSSSKAGEITARCRVCENEARFDIVNGLAVWYHTALVNPIHKVVVHGIFITSGDVDPGLLVLATESVKHMEKETPGFDEGARWAERRRDIPLEKDGLPAHGRIAESVAGVATPNEVRITNEKTGGQKGSKDAKYHLIPAGPLKELAELYGVGAKKYAPRNWELGYDWSLSYDALQRHANQFWAGEDKDEETGKSHLASVIFHAMALMQFAEEHPELDDRPHISKEKP